MPEAHFFSLRGGRAMRSRFIGLLSVAILLSSAVPLWACLNDREVKSQEQEFKSSYEEQPATPYTPEQESPSPDSWVWTTLPSVAGSVLLAGALTLGLMRSKRS